MSFSGAAFYNPWAPVLTAEDAASTDNTLNAAILTTKPGNLVPQNRGGIGDGASLTSYITLRRGQEVVTVGALLDAGSEASYFHPSIERFGVSTKKKCFKLETLSTTGDGPEDVD